MREIIEQVIAALEAISIPAVRGFSGDLQPELRSPAAAVSVEKAGEGILVLCVRVCCPAGLGGAVCENAAGKAAEAMRKLGAQCTQEGCDYQRSTGLLSVRLVAAWPLAALPYQVRVAGAVLPHVAGIYTEKKGTLCPIEQLGSEMLGVRWEDTHWDITLEELLPGTEAILDVGTETFLLEIIRPGGTEAFPLCRWVSVRREDTAQGIRQVRIARTWKNREVING